MNNQFKTEGDKYNPSPILFEPEKMKLLNWMLTEDGFNNWNTAPPIQSCEHAYLVELMKKYSKANIKIDNQLLFIDEIIGLDENEQNEIRTSFRIIYDHILSIKNDLIDTLKEKNKRLEILKNGDLIKLLAEKLWWARSFLTDKENTNVDARNNIFYLCKIYLYSIQLINDEIKNIENQIVQYGENYRIPKIERIPQLDMTLIEENDVVWNYYYEHYKFSSVTHKGKYEQIPILDAASHYICEKEIELSIKYPTINYVCGFIEQYKKGLPKPHITDNESLKIQILKNIQPSPFLPAINYKYPNNIKTPYFKEDEAFDYGKKTALQFLAWEEIAEFLPTYEYAFDKNQQQENNSNTQEVEKSNNEEIKENTEKQINKPTFKTEQIDSIFGFLKGFFEVEEHDKLKKLLENGLFQGSKLFFKDNGNRLAHAFKLLKENDIITGCEKRELETWIMENFKYRSNKETKEYIKRTLTDIISTTKEKCKKPLFKIENGIILKV